MNMPKSSKSIFAVNLLLAGIWFALFFGLAAAVHGAIVSVYAGVGTAESIRSYVKSIYVEFGVAAVLAVIWWTGLLTTHDGWRRSAECYNFVLTPICCFAAFVFAAVSCIRSPGIYDTYGVLHKLRYAFIAPFLFTGLSYGLAPVTVQRILLPCRHGGAARIVICAAALGLVLWIFVR